MPVLVVQTGHVGRPPAPFSVGTAGEQEFTKRAGAACARLLNRDGWTVRIIEADPGYPNPATIGGDKSAYKGDAFVAIHCDGSTNPDRNGASWGYREAGRGFAADIKSAYLLRTGREATWCEPDNYTTNLSGYYGLGMAANVGNTRAVIMECGFLTNPQDRDMLLAPTGPDDVALAIGDALGMHLQETTIMGDMDWGDMLNPTSVAVEHYPLSAAVSIRGAYDWGGSNGAALNTANSKLTALGPPVARIEAKVDQLLALHGGTASFEDAMAKIGAASAEAASHAAVAALQAEFLPAVREVLREELGADNEEQAAAVISRIADKLRAA